MAVIQPDSIDYSRRHLRIGWWTLAVFLAAGFALEILHGFKVGFYLDVDNEHRRLMWTLAHAHGALIALVHLTFGLSLLAVPAMAGERRRLISLGLTSASVVLPAGFFIAGIGATGPALGFLMVPVGGALLMAAVCLLALAASQ